MESLLHQSCCENHVPLSPISFLEKASIVYGDQVSIVYGTMKYTWKETHERCLKLASALCLLDISRGDIVAALAPNVPALYELHFGVPMAGAVLSALNPRLDTATLAVLLEQLEARIIFVDHQFVPVVLKAFDILSHQVNNYKPPQLVLIPEHDPENCVTVNGTPPGSLDYNGVLAMGQVDFVLREPKTESDPISVNYTSGSTGTPKGVVYSHRAAYLNSLGQVFRSNMSSRETPVFLWTVDMFRCNGWCFPWAIAALGGTNICLRNLSGKTIFDAISIHSVTHLCGAPVLLNMIADCDQIRPLPRRVEIIVAGALPPAQKLSKVVNLGFNITHSYGMTEALGPVIPESWEPDDDGVFQSNRHNFIIEGADVKDPSTLKSVPFDGKTIGEVMFRGNTLMTGYFKNLEATREAFVGGWYRTGDLGIRHPDGHIQMKDRMKDGIISGNETISTLEVEAVLVSHPMVSEAAVVGKPDDRLGEVPCAFVKLKETADGTTSAEEIIEFCKGKLSGYMVPQSVVFGDLPVNSTGKIQKFVLRERIKAMGNHTLL